MDAAWYTHRYAHLSSVNVSVWQSVVANQSLWGMGNSGYVIPWSWWDGSHLDYSIKRPNWSFMKSDEVVQYVNSVWTSSPSQKIIDWATSILLWLPEWDTKRLQESLKSAISDWDKERALSQLRNGYRSSLSTAEQTKLNSRDKLAFDLQNIKQDFETYVANGWDVWFFTWQEEALRKKVGKTKDPELAKLQTKIMDRLDLLARERTGAAMTVSEEAFYARLLPWIDKDMELNSAIIDGLLETIQDDSAYIDYKLSKSLDQTTRNFFFGETIDMSHSENQSSFIDRATQQTASSFLD